MTAAELARLAATIAVPVEEHGERARAAVDVIREERQHPLAGPCTCQTAYRVYFARRYGLEKEFVAPDFATPREAIALARALNGEEEPHEPANP